MMVPLKNKKVLVLGLGLLGGGVATTNWLLDQGALVTVSDLKDAKALASSVKRIEEHLKKSARDGEQYDKIKTRLTWALGGHKNSMIDAADIVVVNPDVSVRNSFVQRAIKKGIRVLNEGTIFYSQWKKPIIGITGTRGKTTTTHWAHHLIQGSVLTGNSTTKPFLSVLDNASSASLAVTELSSFILELFPHAKKAPDVAVVTNLYRDHLNRHGTMQGYATAKSRIFEYQTTKDVLILNADDTWTEWFLKQNPKSRVMYFSLKPLSSDREGLWYDNGTVFSSLKITPVLELGDFEKKWGRHNVANLLAAALAAHLAGVPWRKIQARLASVPQVPYRQEVVHQDRKVTVVNDTTATSPEGAIAALQRWGGPNCILITGGTDRDLDFHRWADELIRYIRPTNTIFLSGSATDKMRKALGTRGRGIRSYDSLERCWQVARKRSRLFVSSVIVFSPAAKSFELFENEFDRGQQFNVLVREEFQ